MKEIELLAPAGDFESLVAAVQNGANAVYFGSDKLNARINSKNFDKTELAKAINYAKIRNVKTHLTLNILIKNNEFEEAIELVEYVYKLGIDAVIVQDLGLAKKIIENFPDLEVHSSTQMTTYNLDGVKQLEEIGFKRVVLSRELSIDEINYICKNTNLDIEVFIHGALCISYSGQCLMSSMIGGRSGNRGKCAGTCRLPYELINKETNKILESGYLLSSKDVCTLEIIPELIETGVKSFKIEGRMKSPEYVALCTSIYRKYIDLALSNKEYKVEKEDKQKLMQVFNRGEFSKGYLKGKLGKDMMYTKRPNHLGIYLGEVISYNSNKGYVKVKLFENINLGDSIRVGEASCKSSELMQNNNNIKSADMGQIVTIGRLKGNIKPHDKIYKTVDIKLRKDILETYSKENIKRKVNCKIILKESEKIIFEAEDIISGIKTEEKGNIVPEKAIKQGITKQRIIEQLMKTGNTIFKLENVIVDMDENIVVPISSINEIRRTVLEKLESEISKNILRKPIKAPKENNIKDINEYKNNKISILFNNLNPNIKYEKLEEIDNIYIPFKLFLDKKLEETINNICNKFNTYIYLPAITKENYEKLLKENLDKILSKKINGIVVSNLSQLELLKDKKIKLIANYTMNITNNNSIKELEILGFNKIILSPEFSKEALNDLSGNIEKETIVYGRALLMTTEYCLIGKFKNCDRPCERGTYTLKDRLGFEFPIYTDRINCNNMIYNSKITSISSNELNINSMRIDILDETEEEIKNIINIHKLGQRLEGQKYTNGNINKEI